MIVNIAVCTCYRAKLLKQALNSFLTMKQPSSVDLFITVVDNDDAQSAKSTVQEFMQNAPFEVFYLNETKRGVPFARNKAIKHSISIQADILIFLDDDEFVSESWLEELLISHRKHGSRSIICGRVISKFPESTSEYYRPFFSTDLGKSGRQLKVCATNNVLIPVVVFNEFELVFDASKPLAGGTDSIFFNEAVRCGMKIFYCAEAVVYENIPQSRLSLKWLSKRKYRAGITMTQIDRSNGKSGLAILVLSVLKILQYVLVAAACFASNRKSKSLHNFLKMVRACGKITGVFGVKVDSYKKLDNVD